MIIASKERYMPVVINTLVLTKGEWYFYIHRDVYDQMVILSDRFEKPESLAELIGGSRINEETVRWFYEQTPKPLNILAPYIQLIEGTIEKDMELCCGALHVISAMINLRGFILKPPEVRKSVSFTLSIKEEYELAWESFFMSAMPYEQRDLLTLSAQRLALMMNGMSGKTDLGGAIGAIGGIARTETPVDATGVLEGYSQLREPDLAATGKGPSEKEKSATKKLLM
ncbi:hypothetical protein [Cohnella cholangitidis]|uniref:Uncharacterized protein n=1 Tax=Cohnella cholangitidis TaxID=2598458 RepID=A0A7G5BU60_9BACL|nr:hypothetical protein [Cohnella cholangitidis]QMV40494.1 hypothetical protein FPL14_04200 [Cohnella cholangitidis]